jgi:ribonucleotide monophosphatase NagD (HAD superfamily)
MEQCLPYDAIVADCPNLADIAFGKDGGLRTFLPMTGVTTMADLEAVSSSEAPDFWMPTLATLAGIRVG